jgi:hypothetical protein
VARAILLAAHPPAPGDPVPRWPRFYAYPSYTKQRWSQTTKRVVYRRWCSRHSHPWRKSDPRHPTSPARNSHAPRLPATNLTIWGHGRVRWTLEAFLDRLPSPERCTQQDAHVADHLSAAHRWWLQGAGFILLTRWVCYGQRRGSRRGSSILLLGARRWIVEKGPTRQKHKARGQQVPHVGDSVHSVTHWQDGPTCRRRISARAGMA